MLISGHHTFYSNVLTVKKKKFQGKFSHYDSVSHFTDSIQSFKDIFFLDITLILITTFVTQIQLAVIQSLLRCFTKPPCTHEDAQIQLSAGVSCGLTRLLCGLPASPPTGAGVGSQTLSY